VYNFSRSLLVKNVCNTISHFNEQCQLIREGKQLTPSFDSSKANWAGDWINKLKSKPYLKENTNEYRFANYRPFMKCYTYFDIDLNASRYQLPKIFPTSNSENIIICVSASPNDGLALLISNSIVDIHFNGDTQCFPLYYYEANNTIQKGMFDEDNKNDFIRRDSISDFILGRAKKIYGKNVTKDDIFYYVYGFLHSKEYRETFANDLKKMLPRLPLVEDVKDFWKFNKAGSVLAELHLNYETVAPFADAKVTGDDGRFYTVEKLRFPKKDQKHTIIYNSKITISNIPAQAYEYVVNGKSAIEWIMERYQVSTHKESGIVNNPNDWSTEVGNPRYILDLLLSIINVSVQTVGIVNALPRVDFGTKPIDSKVVNIYATGDAYTGISIAAEPGIDM
jgi:predicted helicase